MQPRTHLPNCQPAYATFHATSDSMQFASDKAVSKFRLSRREQSDGIAMRVTHLALATHSDKGRGARTHEYS